MDFAKVFLQKVFLKKVCKYLQLKELAYVSRINNKSNNIITENYPLSKPKIIVSLCDKNIKYTKHFQLILCNNVKHFIDTKYNIKYLSKYMLLSLYYLDYQSIDICSIIKNNEVFVEKHLIQTVKSGSGWETIVLFGVKLLFKFISNHDHTIKFVCKNGIFSQILEHLYFQSKRNFNYKVGVIDKIEDLLQKYFLNSNTNTNIKICLSKILIIVCKFIGQKQYSKKLVFYELVKICLENGSFICNTKYKLNTLFNNMLKNWQYEYPASKWDIILHIFTLGCQKLLTNDFLDLTSIETMKKLLDYIDFLIDQIINYNSKFNGKPTMIYNILNTIIKCVHNSVIVQLNATWCSKIYNLILFVNNSLETLTFDEVFLLIKLYNINKQDIPQNLVVYVLSVLCNHVDEESLQLLNDKWLPELSEIQIKSLISYLDYKLSNNILALFAQIFDKILHYAQQNKYHHPKKLWNEIHVKVK